MLIYWDGRQWVVSDGAGGYRPATAGELAEANNPDGEGKGARFAAPRPEPDAPIPIDPTIAAQQQQAANAAAAAAAKQQQQLQWQQSDPNTRLFGGPLDEAQRAYFTKQDPSGYFRQFVDFFGDPNSNKGQYALSQYAQSQADYGRASSQDESVLFPDLLTKAYWDKLDQGFSQQSWRERGESAPQMNAGRIVW